MGLNIDVFQVPELDSPPFSSKCPGFVYVEGMVGHARETGIDMLHMLLAVIACDHYNSLPCSTCYVTEVAVDVVVVVVMS